IIPATQAKQLDVGMGGMSTTEKRKETVAFSDPYFEAGITLTVSAKNDDISGLDDLKDIKVVVNDGTVSAAFAKENQEKYGYSLTNVNDSASMFQEVMNGSSDALMEDYPVISYAISEGKLQLKTVGDRLTGDNYGISVLKGRHADLLEKINKGLA